MSLGGRQDQARAELGISRDTQTRLTVKKLKFYLIHTRKFLMTKLTTFPVRVLLGPRLEWIGPGCTHCAH